MHIKSSISLFFLCFFFNCKTAYKYDASAVTYYNERLLIIENYFLKEKISNELLLNAIIELEEVTKIYCYIEDNSIEQAFKLPIKRNLDEWKKWINLKKNILIFDKKNQKMTIKKGANPLLYKNSFKRYISYVNELEKMNQTKEYDQENINFFIQAIERITSYNKVTYNNDCECTFPSKEDFLYLKNWFKSHSLMWNKEKQVLEIHPK